MAQESPNKKAFKQAQTVALSSSDSYEVSSAKENKQEEVEEHSDDSTSGSDPDRSRLSGYTVAVPELHANGGIRLINLSSMSKAVCAMSDINSWLGSRGSWQTLVFPLCTDQLSWLMDGAGLRVLADEVRSFGKVAIHIDLADEGLLAVRVPDPMSKERRIHLIRTLKTRLGSMGPVLSLEEIKKIREIIHKDDSSGPAVERRDVCASLYMFASVMVQMCDLAFHEDVTSVLHHGLQFLKHKKGGEFELRYVCVRNDRLYFRKPLERKHSFRVRKIKNIVIGKLTKALKHESLTYIPSDCCCSVVFEKSQKELKLLDLSLPTLDAAKVRMFVACLEAIQRHVVETQSKDDKEIVE